MISSNETRFFLISFSSPNCDSFVRRFFFNAPMDNVTSSSSPSSASSSSSTTSSIFSFNLFVTAETRLNFSVFEATFALPSAFVHTPPGICMETANGPTQSPSLGTIGCTVATKCEDDIDLSVPVNVLACESAKTVPLPTFKPFASNPYTDFEKLIDKYTLSKCSSLENFDFDFRFVFTAAISACGAMAIRSMMTSSMAQFLMLLLLLLLLSSLVLFSSSSQLSFTCLHRNLVADDSALFGTSTLYPMNPNSFARASKLANEFTFTFFSLIVSSSAEDAPDIAYVSES